MCSALSSSSSSLSSSSPPALSWLSSGSPAAEVSGVRRGAGSLLLRGHQGPELGHSGKPAAPVLDARHHVFRRLVRIRGRNMQLGRNDFAGRLRQLPISDGRGIEDQQRESMDDRHQCKFWPRCAFSPERHGADSGQFLNDGSGQWPAYRFGTIVRPLRRILRGTPGFRQHLRVLRPEKAGDGLQSAITLDAEEHSSWIRSSDPQPHSSSFSGGNRLKGRGRATAWPSYYRKGAIFMNLFSNWNANWFTYQNECKPAT